jgi:hypothetical protein
MKLRDFRKIIETCKTRQEKSCEREFANGRASRKVPPEDTVRGRGGTWRGLRRGRG